jgi:hypothetical protein
MLPPNPILNPAGASGIGDGDEDQRGQDGAKDAHHAAGGGVSVIFDRCYGVGAG